MDFMRLPLIVAVGFLLYGESAELLVLLGAVMIFAGNYYSIRREHRRRAEVVA
jgi:S-adenosylmethionine uptake transporter